MGRLLYLKASPRGARSKSCRVAETFLTAYQEANPDDQVVTIDLFTKELPPFDGPAVETKYAIMHGQTPTDSEVATWRAIEEVIEEFNSADKYVLAVPMWNFGIPYRLKQYIDLIVQPGYTFSFSPEEGYKGLVIGKPVLVSYARAGDYSLPEMAAADMQKPYLELILGFMGFTEIHTIVVEPTLAGGPEVAEQKSEEAITEARLLATSF